MAPGTAVAAQLTEEDAAWVAKQLKSGLTEYEVQRLQTIRKNQRVMAELGLLQAADTVKKSM